MRYAMLGAMISILGIVMPALAANKNPTPSWDDCYKLGMDRGVHVELGELPEWIDECLAGRIEFNSVAPRATKGRPHTRAHHNKPESSGWLIHEG